MRQFLELPLTPPAAAAWPDWLEACRIDDDALGEAYDHVSMPHRAGIKQCMAFCQSVYGTAAEHGIHAQADSGQGVWRSERSAPAPWALVIIAPEYDAPARLTAAIMPAVLARVPRVALLCVDGLPQESARAVLELTGLEDSFITGMAQTEDLIRALHAAHASCGAGRLLLLHKGELSPLRTLAAELNIPCMEEAVAPRIGILQGKAEALRMPHAAASFSAEDSAEIDREQLAFAHGTAGAHPLPVTAEQAACRPENRQTEDNRSAGCSEKTSNAETRQAQDTQLPAPFLLDACFAEEQQLAAASRLARLTLASGMEGCWLHAALTRGFFRNTTITAGLCLPDTDFFSGGGYEGAD